MTAKSTIKFFVAFAIALVALMAIRVLCFGVLVVGGNALEPTFIAGDRVLVNRWSYGLRVGTKVSLFGYGRLGRSEVRRGDIVAFENPANRSEMLLGRCTALPGETVAYDGQQMVVPSLKDCADGDYYWLESLCNKPVPFDSLPPKSRQIGCVAEEFIIGRAFAIFYSFDPSDGFFQGWRGNRFFTSINTE